MDNFRQSHLPPLPPSDSKSLEWNQYDYYYKYKARDFWGEAEIIRVEAKPHEKCEHYFVSTQGGAECKKCHFGLLGPIEISNGQILTKK